MGGKRLLEFEPSHVNAFNEGTETEGTRQLKGRGRSFPMTALYRR